MVNKVEYIIFVLTAKNLFEQVSRGP